jgi:hypothetical protein
MFPYTAFSKDSSNTTTRCISLYNTLREDVPEPLQSLMGTAKPGDDKISPPLQAADLLAGAYRMSCQYQQYTAPTQVLRACGKTVHGWVLSEHEIRSFVALVNLSFATRILTDINKTT